MEWKSAVSNHPDLGSALASALDTIEVSVSRDPDVFFVFSSPHHRENWALLGPIIRRRFPNAKVVGCSGGAVIGGGYEVERGPALAVTSAYLPGVEIGPFFIPEVPSAENYLGTEEWLRRLGLDVAPENLILLPDPLSLDAQDLCCQLENAFPGVIQLGGLASGGNRAGEHALFLGDKVYRTGTIGLSLNGNVVMDTVVAQGCRAVGPPLFVTRAESHILFELDGRPALSVLEEVCRRLSPAELELAQRSLFLGLVMEPDRESYGGGDFLIRNLLGAMSEVQALAVGAQLDGQSVVQFHVRDARASWADLDHLLEVQRDQRPPPVGALMFSCLGRGRHLYGEEGHDSRLVEHHLGPLPIGGFFCNGEIGPVGGKTWVHGYTSAIGFFRPKSDA